ncbi:MAG: hypothetical protein IJU20_00175 [Clostridia bacterium]|nr:hypothetical protein [Clostridia bacterium]
MQNGLYGYLLPVLPGKGKGSLFLHLRLRFRYGLSPYVLSSFIPPADRLFIEKQKLFRLPKQPSEDAQVLLLGTLHRIALENRSSLLCLIPVDEKMKEFAADNRHLLEEHYVLVLPEENESPFKALKRYLKTHFPEVR